MKRIPHLVVSLRKIALMIALASQAGCGAARQMGKGAAEGAIGALAGKAGGREGFAQATKGVKRRAIGGAMDELSQPERLDDIQRIAAAMAAGASRAALERAGEGGRPEAQGASPVEAIAAQGARAFSQELTAELGRAGEGPLASSLAATTEQVTASMARGAQGELAPLFPECRGEAAATCLDRAVERVSRASAAGIAAGIRESLGVWPLVVAFGVGAFSALALAWAWAIYGARRPARTP